MPEPSCANCGHPLPVDGRFCSRCGASVVPRGQPPVVAPPVAKVNLNATLFDPQVAPAMAKASQATMFGYAPLAVDPVTAPAVAAPPPLVAPEPPPPPPAKSQPAPGLASAKSTMLGLSTELLGVKPLPAGPASDPPPANYNAKSTMLGVALPGIAPTHSSAPSAPAATPALGGKSGTMLGVAIPGIAPVRSSAPATNGYPVNLAPAPVVRPRPVVLPKPAPLVDDEPALGPAPRLARRGVPVASVAAGVFALVLVFGGLVAFLWKGQSLVVLAKQDAQGHDQLHLTCESCQDGTTAELDGARATFASKEADLVLSSALKVGDNALSIRLDRPRWGRDEAVKVVVPVAYRIKADLAPLTEPHPSVVVRVQAVTGTIVHVDGKPVALDGQGSGTYALDVGAQTTGFSDDLRLVDQAIPYSILPPGSAATEQRGTLAVRAGVATLHLDTPLVTTVIDTASFRVAGHTLKGGTITLNGQPVTVDADGSFATTYPAPSLGDVPVELRASGPELASRTARFTVKRVAKLAAEAKTREKAPWIDYDGMVSGGAGAVGKLTVVEGDVVDARATGGQVIALVDDIRGCTLAKGTPCLVRVVATSGEPIARGDHVRVYGRVSGTVAPSGGGAPSVPGVEADFYVKGKSGR